MTYYLLIYKKNTWIRKTGKYKKHLSSVSAPIKKCYAQRHCAIQFNAMDPWQDFLMVFFILSCQFLCAFMNCYFLYLLPINTSATPATRDKQPNTGGK